VEKLDQYLCGATRPGHFRGVCTVVLKFLNIITPTVAYFGQKDFQQARIIQRMVQDLNMTVIISTMPTVREPSGLAISSRNLRLSSQVKERASAIFRGLSKAQKMYTEGEKNSSALEHLARQEIDASCPDSIDYLTVVAQKSLHPVSRVEGPAVLATAVFYDGVRLIDNILLEPI
jgi:pantoate--beta-alanine ligase